MFPGSYCYAVKIHQNIIFSYFTFFTKKGLITEIYSKTFLFSEPSLSSTGKTQAAKGHTKIICRIAHSPPGYYWFSGKKIKKLNPCNML